MGLVISPCTLNQANALITKIHRHHKPVVGHRFSIAALDHKTGDLIGVAIVGRPVSRRIDPYRVAEVLRLATDGRKNACSFLYSACARICKEMGFEKIQTYILDSEPGTSLRASGWEFEAETTGGDWNREHRGGRRLDQPMCSKQRWGKVLNPTLPILENSATISTSHEQRTQPAA